MNTINIPKEGKDTCIMIVAPIGSRFENPKLKGISHFLEHMVFKGSKKHTQKAISYGIERYGGYLNAFTGKEITYYIAKISNQHRKQALDILKDMTANPIVLQKEVDKERRVILEEIKMYEDNSASHVVELVSRYIYRNNSGLYIGEGGTPKTLSKINRKELLNYHSDNYDDLTLIQVGNVKKKELLPLITIAVPEEIEIKNLNKKFLIKRNDIKQANVTISNYVNLRELIPLDKKLAFGLIHSIMSGMSGRLFRVIREKYNMVYSIQMLFSQLTCGGVQWWIALGLKKENINKAYELIVKELTRPFTADEINYGIEKRCGGKDLYLSNSKYIAEEVCEASILGIDYNEVLHNYKNNYKRIGKHINEIQKEIHFDKNVLLGIVPK